MQSPRPLRILIITHSPLSSEFGAGQMAINLGDALRAQGYDVVVWSPHPLEKTRWWQSLQQMRSKADAFIATEKPFDVIDCPPTLITRKMCGSALVVARSTQPSLSYLAIELASATRKRVNIARLPFIYAYKLFHIFLILQDWKRADQILCLGSLELEWMKRRFPWWRSKLASYVNALSESDQAALATVRQQRNDHNGCAIRFLWIGRWTSHKGTDTLIKFIKDWSKQRPQDSFTIAGCGTEAEKDCPPELLESGRIKIIPSFTREELYSLLANHDAGLFTSKVEGWGLVLNEMLESGMPVFATLAGGTTDLMPFVSSLMPFPPSPESVYKLEKAEVSDDYYSTFDWSRIAEGYANTLFTGLHEEESLKLEMTPQ